MILDYLSLTDAQLEDIEKASARAIIQALQEYSREAKQIFDYTPAASETEVIVLAEDILQYALEVAEFYPINKRYAGFIDYKRVRWFPSHLGLIPQALLVDAKASTENNRDTLQRSQLPIDAEFTDAKGIIHQLKAGVFPHLPIMVDDGSTVQAVSTSVLVHFYYVNRPTDKAKSRELKSIFVLSIPHARLKSTYNPDPTRTFFGQGKHSPARNEEPRIRVYFSRLREMCPWRLQELRYQVGSDYTAPIWRDADANGESETPFRFIPR